MEGGVLVSPEKGDNNRLQVGYSPPEEYTLEATVERLGGDDLVLFGLAAGGRQFAVELDGWKGTITALHCIDGKLGDANETTLKGKVLANSKAFQRGDRHPQIGNHHRLRRPIAHPLAGQLPTLLPAWLLVGPGRESLVPWFRLERA